MYCQHTLHLTLVFSLIAVVFLPNRASTSDFDQKDCGIEIPVLDQARVSALGASGPSIPRPHAPCLDCGEPVSYTSFGGISYTLTRFEGAFVELLLPDTWTQGAVLTDQQIRLFIDRADYLYTHTAELVRREPAGAGKLTIAVIDSTCGLGCGYIGSRGVEILSTQGGIDHVLNALNAGVIPGAVSHEMMHNFDVYNAHLFHGGGSPGAHAWTAFIGPYLDFFAQMGTPTRSPEDAMSEWIEETLHPYLADPAADWLSCVSTGQCSSGIAPDLAWAGISNRFAELHGPEAIQSFFGHLDSYALANAPAATLQGKADLHLELMAAAVNEDLRCYVDHWKWSISPALDSEMALLPAASFCEDGDLDGVSQLEGDCDDGDEFVYPGAPEKLNGIDDSCSGTVDDLEYVEPSGGDFPTNQLVSLPSLIQGEIPTGDHDDFTFDLTAPQSIEIEMCSDGFQGFLFVLNEDNSWFDYQYVFANSCHSKVYELDEARVWRFDVALNAASLPGAYAVSVRSAPPVWPAEVAWGEPDAVSEAQFPVTLGTQSVPTDPAYTPTDARFWVSGIGFTEPVPYTTSAAVPFTPLHFGEGEYTYRVQLLSSGVPATDWSSEVTFVPEPGMKALISVGVLALWGRGASRFRPGCSVRSVIGRAGRLVSRSEWRRRA